MGLEAMASGRPVVFTEQTGIAEIVAGTEAGTVVAADDPRELAEALRPFLLDAAAAGGAGLHARLIVERECSPERTAEQREAVYREAIGVWSTRRTRIGCSIV